MAYLDVDLRYGAAPATAAEEAGAVRLPDPAADARAEAAADVLVATAINGCAPAAADEGRFSALEWTVIALARRDGIGSLNEPGRLARALGSLFGLGTASRLADPRLEALRRLAVHAWHRSYAVPVSAIKGFKAQGYGMAQVETLLASIGAARAAGGRRVA